LFYAWWTPKFLILIVALTVVTWFTAILIEKSKIEKVKTQLMAAAIVINLASLAWYKYANVVVKSLNAIFSEPSQPLIVWENVLLPIALSFTVLHATSYLVDVRRGVVKAQHNLSFLARILRCFRI